MKRLLAIALTISVASCDTSTTADGTSSETQSSLQALADSIAAVVIPFPASNGAARSLYGGRWWDDTARTVYFAYLFQPDGSRITSMSEVRDVGDQQFMKSVYFASPSCEIMMTSGYTYANDVDLWFNGRGRTRAGFRFGWSKLQPEDARRFGLDSVIVERHEFLRYEFGRDWMVIVPPFELQSLGFDSLRIFSGDGSRQLGVLVSREPGSERPIWDWSAYRVIGTDGSTWVPRKTGRLDPWVSDSLGLLIGKPRIGDDGSTLELPFRWKFLAGTAKAVSESRERGCSIELVASPSSSTDTALFHQDFRPGADSGDDMVRIPNSVSSWIAGNAIIRWPHDCSSRDSFSTRRVYFNNTLVDAP